MTATYWEIGRRIVQFEPVGQPRAEYGEELLKQLAGDLTQRFGRGLGVDNLQRMRLLFLAYPANKIYATLSRKSSSAPIRRTPPAKSGDSSPQRSSQIYQTLSGKSSTKISATALRKSLFLAPARQPAVLPAGRRPSAPPVRHRLWWPDRVLLRYKRLPPAQSALE